jgi:hypothetical protein
MIQKIISFFKNIDSFIRKINLNILILTILTIFPWKITINSIEFNLSMGKGLLVVLNNLPLVNIYLYIFYLLVLFFVVYFSYYYINYLLTSKPKQSNE